MRETRLITDGSVCEDAHSYLDPNVKTASDARAKGRIRCPVFNECMFGNMLDKRNLRCAARFGQEVAKYAMMDSNVAAEMQDFRREAFPPGLQGFIDPYKDPENIITDKDEASAAVEEWANTILYGPEKPEDPDISDIVEGPLPSFSTLVERAMTEDGAIDLSKIDNSSSTKIGPVNGGIRCDVSSGPCACGAWH